MYGASHILFKGDMDILYRSNMLESQLSMSCPVCALSEDLKANINSAIILEGDLQGIAEEFSIDYTAIQEHAQHLQMDEIIPSGELKDEVLSGLEEKLEKTNNPADIVYLMTLIMKVRVSPLIRDKTPGGLAQLDKINRAIRDNAGVIGKLREEMREGDMRKIESLEEMITIYRGVLLGVCDGCGKRLRNDIDKAIANAQEIHDEMIPVEDAEDMEELPDVTEALVG